MTNGKYNLCVQMTVEMLQQLDAYAEEVSGRTGFSVTRSSAVRSLISKGLRQAGFKEPENPYRRYSRGREK